MHLLCAVQLERIPQISKNYSVKTQQAASIFALPYCVHP